MGNLTMHPTPPQNQATEDGAAAASDNTPTGLQPAILLGLNDYKSSYNDLRVTTPWQNHLEGKVHASLCPPPQGSTLIRSPAIQLKQLVFTAPLPWEPACVGNPQAKPTGCCLLMHPLQGVLHCSLPLYGGQVTMRMLPRHTGLRPHAPTRRESS